MITLIPPDSSSTAVFGNFMSVNAIPGLEVGPQGLAVQVKASVGHVIAVI